MLAAQTLCQMKARKLSFLTVPIIKDYVHYECYNDYWVYLLFKTWWHSLVSIFLCLCPLLGSGGIMFSGCLSVHPSEISKYSKLHDWKFLENWWKYSYDMTMNWIDFGFHRSKGESTTGPICAKIQFRRMEKTNFYSGKHFWKKYWGPMVKSQSQKLTKCGQNADLEL